ncbi:uncharacterized protein [Aquarana catesbeiana]|uniref:uncharacterized protein n=1 Tax=Aquarana catesbeiana TaxID=8400 RepID=UPI003CC9E769
MMENRPPLTSSDGSCNINTPETERCPNPQYSRDSTQEHHEIPQEDQVEGLFIVKVEGEEERRNELCKKEVPSEIKAEKEEEGHVRIKEEEVPPETITDRSSNRNPPERCPRPLYCWDSTQEQEITQEDQHENLLKAEVKEEAEEPNAGSDEKCKKEEIPPEISTDGQYRRNNTEKSFVINQDDKVEDHEITFDSIIPHFNPVLPGTDESSNPTIHFRRSSDQTYPVTYQAACRESETFLCSECSEYFSQRAELLAHQREHTVDKSFFFFFP